MMPGTVMTGEIPPIVSQLETMGSEQILIVVSRGHCIGVLVLVCFSQRRTSTARVTSAVHDTVRRPESGRG